jgi:hypothetical protein
MINTMIINTFIKANQYSVSAARQGNQCPREYKCSDTISLPYTLTWINWRVNTGMMMISAHCQDCSRGDQYYRLFVSETELMTSDVKWNQNLTCKITAAAVNSLAAGSSDEYRVSGCSAQLTYR